MNEKRSNPRRNVFYYLEIYNQETEEELGRLGDISENGLMLISQEPLPVHSQYDIKIKLPRTENFFTDFLYCSIEIVWRHKDVNPDLHLHGCKAKHQPENISIIRSLIEYYGFSDTYKRKETE